MKQLIGSPLDEREKIEKGKKATDKNALCGWGKKVLFGESVREMSLGPRCLYVNITF
jgi:hypothetical protein